jgi:hypothetical protein
MQTHEHLPPVYCNADGDQIHDPVYRLLAPGFYDDTYFLDGEELVIKMTPNEHMQPLNRSAGERYEQWLGSLPGAGANLKLEDIVEAAHMMRPREGVPELEHDDWTKAVLTLAMKLKEKRTPHGTPQPLGVHRANPSSAPPMPNAAWSDPRTMSLSRPGGNVVHQPKPPAGQARRANRPAMGNVPKDGPVQTGA